jgi:hypothetical protein
VTASQVFNLGKLRFTYKGTYSGSTTYQTNDVVRYNNSLYVFINVGSSSGRVPTETDFWAKMVDGFKDPTSGTNGQFVYTDGTAYQLRSISEVPSQTGEAGKFLKTNGTAASWSNSFGTLGVTGDLEVGSTAGELYIGTNAATVSAAVGVNSKTASTKALTNNVATITTSTAHGFSPFQSVVIALSPADAAFDGTYEIATVPTLNTFTFSRTSGNISSQATVGTVSAIPGFTNPVLFASNDVDEYTQIAFRNANAGSNASTDIILYPDNGTDFSGYIDMGITSSDFSDPEFTITGPNDGYIFMTAPAGTTGAGNLVLATGDLGSENKIIFAAGGLASDNEQMSITPDQNVHIEIATPSTSSTTGALTVVGGVGVQGDMNVEGDMSIVGNLTFGGGATTTDNLAVVAPMIFSGTGNQSDAVDEGLVVEYASTISAIVKTVSNKALTSNVATLTTSASHTYLVGDVVVVSGVDATFNGTYSITAVPTATTFTYDKTASNVTSAAASGSASVSARRYYGGAVRDASDGIFKIFKDATTKPSTTVNFSEAGLGYADLQVAGLTTSALTASGLVSLSGTVDIQEMRETLVPVTISSNIAGCDWSAGNIYWIGTAPSANFTAALTNVPTDNNKVMTINIFVTQGTTGRIPSALTINGGSAESIKWPTAVAPTPTSVSPAGRIDVFTFTLVRVGSAWTVLGSANLNWG